MSIILRTMYETALERLSEGLTRRGLVQADATARRALWLQACDYPGLAILLEALSDKVQTHLLQRSALGLDLQNVSCVFLADEIQRHVADHGRVFLRNVRHGLFLLPDSAELGYGIGCPVDPGFALGGARTNNPYAEKLNLAHHGGVMLDDTLWSTLIS